MNNITKQYDQIEGIQPGIDTDYTGAAGTDTHIAGEVLTTVLVCELREIIAAGIETILKVAACEVVGRCRSRNELLRMAGLLRPEIIIASSSTLGDEAIATCREFRAESYRPRIILLIETNPGITPVDLAELNVDGLLMRDASAATLLECVTSVQQGRSWLDPDLLRHIARPEHAIAIPDNFTPRERGIIDLVALGMSNKKIAREANLSEGTVKMYLHRIFAKLKLANRTQLAMFAHSMQNGVSCLEHRQLIPSRATARRDPRGS